MPDLLLEFFSEEIPARMQARAAEDLKKLVTDRLVAAGLTYDGATAFASPRRLALAVAGIPVRQPDVKEERKGPKVGAPEQAIAGFLRAAGLSSIDQAKVQSDKKGDFYIAVTEKAGKPAIEVIKDVVTATILSFPWPKSMRWGSGSDRLGAMTWVRPLHSILATFGPETEEPEIIRFGLESFGVEDGNITYGHRFMAPAAITVKRFDDYVAKLNAAKVVVDPARRAQMILTDAKTLTFAQGFELVEDEGLLDEVAGLVEWPVVLMGSFDKEFLAIPEEVIRATIRNNQKCFVVRDPATSKLTNKFVLVANIEASDGGSAIIAGNERVIRARLSDAKFFYDTDLKTPLEDRLPKFKQIVFHEKLGTLWSKIERIEILASILAPLVGANEENVQRAATLCKADLLTEMVGEFPELQGLMGRYYADAQGKDESIGRACEDHYKPQGPRDSIPTSPVSIAVALADKIDTLMGFWVINERPTGSKDPYALRRAALGIIRIIIENELRIPLMKIFIPAHIGITDELKHQKLDRLADELRTLPDEVMSARRANRLMLKFEKEAFPKEASEQERNAAYDEIFDLRLFIDDRLETQLRNQGARYDLARAVFELAREDDLLLIDRRIEALAKFLDTDDGKNLLAGTKRAANILRIEEKKDNTAYTGAPDAGLLAQPEEKELARAIGVAKTEADAAVAREDFASAMTAMSKLRPHVDAFFDKVTVNVEDGKLRANRLRLLNEIREATRAVADFSKIEGG